jgi:hypothetical protein
MSTMREHSSTGYAARTRWPWGIVGVLALTAALRLIGIGTWSIWQDEATSIFFACHLEKAFGRCFPVFFEMLAGLYRVTGISVVAGRAMAAAFGLGGIALLYAIVRRWASEFAALAAAAMLAVCLGHLFWSQSIRYYTLLSVVELVACWCMFDGFERAKRGRLVIASLLLGVAMYIHFTAILLVPALVGYLIVVRATRLDGKGYDWKGFLAFGLPTAFAVAMFLPRFLAIRALEAGVGPPPNAIAPTGLIVRTVAYYGVPMVALALASPCLWRRLPPRVLLFFLAITFVPTLELVVMGMRGMAMVCWNHAFISLFGCAALAGMGLAAILEAGWRRSATALAVATAAYYVAFLPAYYTRMHGDRPRWQEACVLVREQGRINPLASGNPKVFATEMEPVALHLGVPPEKMMDTDFLQTVSDEPPTGDAEVAEWYVLREPMISPAWARWLARHCELVERFDAYTGPVSRSVLVFRRCGSNKESRECRVSLR